MPITFTNNWKNILDKLESILRNEFKGSIKVFTGKEDNPGNQYIRLNPVSTELLDYMHSAEFREFSIEMSYHFREPNIKRNSLEHIFRQVSRIEALIHDNVTATLSDSSKITNVQLSSCDLDVGDSDSEYVVEWDLSCQHLANIG